ncbi:MAG: tetratricopeptide repeat protein [Deltaproteobacteria bacterium]|nr:tetratricopeptide repeat protein [Deltaproteobacteria bacterium]
MVRRPDNIALALVIVVAAFAVYGQTLRNGFVYDDNHIILANEWIRDPARIPDILTSSTIFADPARSSSNTYRPLLFIVFMAEDFMFGLGSPWGFHLVNVSLLALNGCLLYGIALMLFAKDDAGGGFSYGSLPPLLAALVFTLHTVNSEVANWASAQAELLFTAFFLAAFWIYAKGGRESAAKAVVPALLYFLALLVKETAIILPALLFASDLIDDGRKIFKRAFNYAIFFGTAVLYMVIRTYAVGGFVHEKKIAFSAFEAFINIFPLITHYLSKLVYPSGLSIIYEFYPARSFGDQRVIAGMIITAVFVLAVAAVRHRPVRLALVWTALPILPVLYIPALSTSAAADRYLYLPTAGFAIIVASIVGAFIRRAGAIRIIAVSICSLALLSSYAAASFKRSAVWREDYTLWADALEKSPKSAHVHYNFAWSSRTKGDARSAIEHYREAIRLSPAGAADAHYNLGLIYTDQYMFDEADFELSAALSLNPGFALASEALARARALKAMEE